MTTTATAPGAISAGHALFFTLKKPSITDPDVTLATTEIIVMPEGMLPSGRHVNSVVYVREITPTTRHKWRVWAGAGSGPLTSDLVHSHYDGSAMAAGLDRLYFMENKLRTYAHRHYTLDPADLVIVEASMEDLELASRGKTQYKIIQRAQKVLAARNLTTAATAS